LQHEGFDANNDAAILETAMRGAGTDEDAIIEVLAHRSVSQRLQIADVYRELFEKVNFHYFSRVPYFGACFIGID
jgi:Annexin